MALFMIERNFAAALNLSAKDLQAVVDVNTLVGVKWLQSFLSADKRKTYCLYEAESGEAIREAARRAGLPARAHWIASAVPQEPAPSTAMSACTNGVADTALNS